MNLRIFSAALLAAGLLAGPLFSEGALARCSKNLVEGPRLLPGVRLVSGDSPNRAVITFVGHASYQIDTPQGVRAITDYNGYNGFGRKPDIVTMNNAHSSHFTDDPVEAEDFLMYLLANGTRISAIKHEGVDLDGTQSDRMLRVAAGRLAARMLGESLHLDPAAVKHRFGFAS